MNVDIVKMKDGDGRWGVFKTPSDECAEYCNDYEVKEDSQDECK